MIAAEIEALLRANADERHARAIARGVVEARPIHTTLELVEVIGAAVPAAYRRQGHPARRTFQALRMAVNDELGRLRAALLQAISLLWEGGRLAVLAYHSGEDRIVKEILREAATGGCTCPADLPCACGASPSVRLLRPLSRTPSTEEQERNPRSRSARLRAAEKHTPESDRLEPVRNGHRHHRSTLMSPTTATAPQRAPQRRQDAPGVRRPDRERRHRHLHSVDASTGPATRGRPKVHIVIGLGVGALFAVLFAVAVLQTVLVQGQIRLDGLQAEVAEAEVQVQNLRAEVGRLESPGRVLDEAGARGMVPAVSVRSVVPDAQGGASAP